MSGALDRARAKRAWPGVIAEVRKLKPPRAAIFDGTEVDVDADGETLVVEFPADAAFKMRQASDADTNQLLRRSLATVLGGVPPFRFQLGRGAVRAPAGEPVEPSPRVDVPPADGGDETVSPAAPAAVEPPVESDAAPPTDDIERLLIDELGAQMIAEHPHEPEGKD
jgi:hypothetical protein